MEHSEEQGEFSPLTQPEYPIRTARLRMRPITLEDLEAVNAYRSIPAVAEYLPHEPHSMEDTRATINRMIEQSALAEPGSWIDFAVELAPGGTDSGGAGSSSADSGGADSGSADSEIAASEPVESGYRAIGEVLLKWDRDEPRSGEIGYVFHPKVHGTGIPTEAVAAGLKVAFEQFNWHRVHGVCDVLNERSALLMSRLGMRKEAELREIKWSKGRWMTFCHYAILQDEWRRSQRP
ncbi:MAG: GNAT family N-acetyltransferase [Cryobacterium sp.]|nr:GNAT family N-acetyltransferase [Cryobacterium sp.]